MLKIDGKEMEMKIDPDDFDYVYNEYIHATNCDICNKKFTNTLDRQLDHDHETGEIRNIICQKCNRNKKDFNCKNSNTGERYISKCKNNRMKTGFEYRITIERDGIKIALNVRNTLEKAIKFRDEFLKNNPDIFT